MSNRKQQTRRRRGWTLATIALGSTATGAAAWFTEPAYRATAPMTLTGMSLPAGMDAAGAESYVLEHLQGVHESAAAATRATDVSAVRVENVEVVTAGPEGLYTVLARLHVTVDDPDPAAAREQVLAIRAAYLELDRSANLQPDVDAEALHAVGQQAQELADLLRIAEAELEAFEQENKTALTASREERTRILRGMERERDAAERRRRALDSRRNDLDRWLADIRREYQRVRAQTDVTAEAVALRQIEWTVLRGLYGAGYGPAEALRAEIAPLRAELDGLLRATAAELEEAQRTLAQLQLRRAPDDPEVIRATYDVSALEARVVELTVDIGSSDLAYIEEVARERREIDDTIAEARAEVAAMDERLAEHRERAARAPEIREQHAVLQHQAEEFRLNHEAARERHDSLQTMHRLAQAQSAGELSAAGEPHVGRPPLRNPTAILGVGGAVTLLSALLLVWPPRSSARATRKPHERIAAVRRASRPENEADTESNDERHG